MSEQEYCEKFPLECLAYEAGKAGMSERKYCRKNPATAGCREYCCEGNGKCCKRIQKYCKKHDCPSAAAARDVDVEQPAAGVAASVWAAAAAVAAAVAGCVVVARRRQPASTDNTEESEEAESMYVEQKEIDV